MSSHVSSGIEFSRYFQLHFVCEETSFISSSPYSISFVIFFLLLFIKGLKAVSLTRMRQSVKTLLIYMDYKVDIVVELLQCFPKLENLFVEVMIFRNVHTIVLVLFQNAFLNFD